VEKAASVLCPYERTPFQKVLVNLSFSVNIFTVKSSGSANFSYELLMFTVAMVTEKLVLDADNDCSNVMVILLCE